MARWAGPRDFSPHSNPGRSVVFNAGMLPRSRSIVIAGAAAAVLASLALAGPASARIIEIGNVQPAIESTCPGTPCVAVSRTTGYQAQVVNRKRSFLVPADGRIVAWTIGLGDPNADQMGYFDQRFGDASASLTVLRRNQFRRKRLIHRVVGRSPVQRLAPYFGQKVQFPLATSIPVKKGFVVAAFMVALDDEIFLVSSAGVTMRIPVRDISSQGRDATGVRVMNLDVGTTVASAAPILSADEDGE